MAPTMTLADIETVFDILQETSEKLHFLVRRFELEKSFKYFGDELDLLGLYLDTGFNLGELELGKHSLVLNQMSKSIDDYYNAVDCGIACKKPKLKKSNWWRDIQGRVAQRRVPRWSEVSVMLLDVSFSEQRRIEKNFCKVKKNIKKKWRQRNHINSVVISPPSWRKDAIVLFGYRERNKELRHEYIENLAETVFSKSHAQRCLVIGVNIDRPDEYPYSVFGVMNRPNYDGGSC